MSRALADSSFIYALAAPNDANHLVALEYSKSAEIPLLPDVILTEVTFLLRNRISYRAVVMFLRSLSKSDAQLEPITLADIRRGVDIMTAYSDARLDFVDCCIMALTERLSITQVLTFDRRVD